MHGDRFQVALRGSCDRANDLGLQDEEEKVAKQ